MIDIDVQLYLGTPTRLARLHKRISLPVVPRVGESIKFANTELGEYFAFHVEQVTHRENDVPEIWATSRRISELKLEEEYWDDQELDQDVATYQREGWRLASCIERKKPNAQPTDRANDEERDDVAVSIERHGRAPRHGSS